nr:unnamed protein product [Callosobruchus analis]
MGQNQPILQKSHLGWIISGTFNIKISNKSTCLLSLNSLQDQIEKFWMLEEISDSSNKYTKTEQFCEDNFVNTTSKNEEGRFIVSLPLKSNYAELGSNFDSAQKRFCMLERKMQRNPAFAESYRAFMREYENLNHMSKLTNDEIKNSNVKFYIPHHAIFKESSATTKTRIVFDGSAKSESGLSLNDVCCVGPTVQDELFIILLRFRTHNYVIKADITKMYRQVLVKTNQRDLQRILWREFPDQELSHYTLNTVTYRTAPASFLATRALQQSALDKMNDCPLASEVILSDFYVDDLITGSDTLENTRKLKSDIQYILSTNGFSLTQWMSNDINILDNFERDQIKNFYISENHTVKTLGILWNPSLDCFQYSVDTNLNTKVTKRIILSIISQIFDPMGLVGCLIITAKILLQTLWKLKIGWDDSVPQYVHTEFINFLSELSKLNNVSIPRHVLLSNYVSCQIHAFSDASQVAYGTCIYIRTTDESDNTACLLLCAKSRVAPLKSISIPRLELCAALLSSRLVAKIIRGLKINPNAVFLWTDSSIVLAWLNRESSELKTFVSNRVSEMQQLTSSYQWRHVRSEDNPADLISRGCDVERLKNHSLWFNGPQWLRMPESQWPILEPKDETICSESLELKPIFAHNSVNQPYLNFNILTRYSSLTKLQRITAYCLRFIDNCRKTLDERNLSKHLTVNEINRAMNILIKLVQCQEFGMEIMHLKRCKEVSKSSKLLSLNPFLDKNEILRVGGRLRHSQLEFDHKHPVILPGHHHFTKLIILYEHESVTIHGGTQTVLGSLRTKFWPLNARCAVRKVIRNCLICFKSRPRNFFPMMGDLPASRITPSRPFFTCGVDMAGPFLIKDGVLRNKRLVKVYIALFICFTTKAIHIEVVGDLSTHLFLNSLKRFFARRGTSKNIYSDNGSNFVGSKNYLSELHEKLSKLNKDSNFHNFLLENRVNWHFSPPRSPTFGGIWESSIKQMKIHLFKVIGNTHLTYEAFYTVLTQIESILNSRPLCPLTDDPDDYQTLTPGHFIVGTRLTSLVEEDVKEIPINRLKHYHHLKYMIQHFWKRWSQEYLHNLQSRTKWRLNDSQQLRLGSLVLIKDDQLHP